MLAETFSVIKHRAFPIKEPGRWLRDRVKTLLPTEEFIYRPKPVAQGFPEHVLSYQAQHPDRSVYILKGSCILSDDGLYEHCEIAKRSGFPILNKAQFPPYEDKLAIVGSGYSAWDTLDQLRQHVGPIMAVKGAHDWLLEQGIIPTFAVAADPQEERHDCFKYLNDITVYLCASQMHPKTWDYMRGRKVVIWHAMINKHQPNKHGWIGVPLVPGGGTTGLRTISLAWIMGFRNIDLYGYDSCVHDGKRRIDGEPVRERDVVRNHWVNEKHFIASDETMVQVIGLMDTIKPLKGLKLNAHGNGIFQEVLRQGKAQGWPV